jgi:glucuronate isomerase
MPILHPDRLFSSDPSQRDVARALYEEVRDLPIVSPHGHTDPAWYADDLAFPDPTELFLIPDHYLLRMLYSQGIGLESLGIVPLAERVEGERVDESSRRTASSVEVDPRPIWRSFAKHYHLFRGTPSRLWLDHALADVFDVEAELAAETADEIYDTVAEKLADPDFRPRALLDRFGIEVIATTDGALDDLRHHARLKNDGWGERVITTFRPDAVIDPEYEGFARNLDALGESTDEDCGTWEGYLRAMADRRAFFKRHGATASDHGHPTATTADLDTGECRRLFDRVRRGGASAAEAELFRGQMLTEMARMSLDDGLVLQIHAGSFRNHNRFVFERFGRDMGADMPQPTEYVRALKPLLDRVGNEPNLTIIAFTLDESTYARELAPLAGHYPVLKLGPPWWFFDSPEGMLRYRRLVTETAGFYNTAGFNDDTRAFLSIPARHDLARRIDCRYLAELVCEHRLSETEAGEVVADLAYGLAKKAYNL